MRKASIILAAIAIVSLGVNAALACDGDHAAAGKTSAAGARMASGCCAGAAGAGAGCCNRGAGTSCGSGAHAADMTSCTWSNIEYRVSAAGEELRTFDRDKALAMSASTGAPVAFYVMDTAYATEVAAQEALVASLDQHVQEMLTLQYVVNGEAVACPQAAAQMSSSGHCGMRYRVAARDFAKKAEAEAYLRKLSAAVQAVRVVDSEGNAVKGCASAHAARANHKLTFKVGDQVAADPATADVLRAREQLRVILDSQA
jgi:hypothetical protein